MIINRDDLEKVIKNLPDYPDILGKEENYFNSAVLISLINIAGEYHFLFELRARKISQENEVCFPGGKYEPKIDKDYQDTAIRETIEELGINKDEIDIKGRFHTVVAPMGATIDTFVAELDIDNIDELNIDRREVAEIY